MIINVPREKIEEFKLRHPEMAGWIEDLVWECVGCSSLYYDRISRGLPEYTNDLEEMYRHLLSCRECKNRLKSTIEYRAKMLALRVHPRLLQLLSE
jgi:hypothetical protein